MQMPEEAQAEERQGPDDLLPRFLHGETPWPTEAQARENSLQVRYFDADHSERDRSADGRGQ